MRANIKNEKKLLSGNLYLEAVKPINQELIEDLNAEIAMEIERSGMNSPRRKLIGAEVEMSDEISRFELRMGGISIESLMEINYMFWEIRLRQMKVFKL